MRVGFEIVPMTTIYSLDTAEQNHYHVLASSCLEVWNLLS